MEEGHWIRNNPLHSIVIKCELLDAFIWGLIGIIVQIVVYLFIEYVLTPKTNLAQKVEEGNAAGGFSLFAMGVTVGLIVAGSLTY